MIDWTKPIEHADGTPLVFSPINNCPDKAGDYYFVREDGEPFTHKQSVVSSVLVVQPSGRGWGNNAALVDGPIVRNRKTETKVKENTTVQIVTVNFGNSYGRPKDYAYLTDIEGVTVGDTVVVDSPSSGLSLVTVVGVEETAEGIAKAQKWIVDKVDTTAHQKRLAEIERRKLITAKLEKMQKEMAEADRFAALAATNPEAAALIAELRALTA